ncbi:unnamed protein product [Ectocarpus sp. 12 AP-2014]
MCHACAATDTPENQTLIERETGKIGRSKRTNMRAAITLVLVAVLSAACPCLSFLRCSSPRLSRSGAPCSTRSGPTGRSRAHVQRSCVKPAAALEPWALAIRRAAVARSTALRMAGDEGETEVAMGMPKPPVEPIQEKSNLPFYLDPSTRRVLGGAVVVPTLSLLLPLGAYGALTAVGVDGSKAGAWVGVGYTLIGLIAWVGSYFFRVATKNMTYAVQLKNYEQAVIEKRFSELEEEEVDALLDEVNEQ